MCRAAVPITEFRRLSRHAASGPQARRMRRTTVFILEPPDLQGQPPTSDTIAIFDLDGLRCMAYNALGAWGYQALRNASGPRILNVTGRPEDLWYSCCRSRQRRLRCGLPCGGQDTELYGKLTANGRCFPFRWRPPARTIHLPIRRRPWLSPQAKHTRRDDD